MRLEWSPNADGQLEELRVFLSRTSPHLADSTVDRLTRRLWQIADFPESGAVYEDLRPLGIRSVAEGTYRLFYVVAQDHVLVVGIRHTSRRPL